jgi:hypothetical protein
MNQHDFVRGCLAFYEEDCLTPEKGWDKAHYPAPKNLGESTVWMTHNHHQHQGLLQSREYGQCCFYNGDAYRFLTKGPFVPGWFELWDIYEEYKGENGRKMAELGVGAHAPEMRGVGGRKAAELGVGAHAPEMRGVGGKKTAELGVGVHAPGMQSKGGRKGGTKGGAKSAELGVGVHAPGKASEGGKKGSKTTNSQKWQSTDPRFPPYTSTPCGLTHWQKALGIDTKMRVRVK